MSMPDRLEAVIRKAAALLPENVGHRLLALLSPKSLAVMAGIIVIWAGADFAGIGELADVVLLVAGWISVGSGAVAGARKLIAFAIATASARNRPRQGSARPCRRDHNPRI